jgi:hypothetical protein
MPEPRNNPFPDASSTGSSNAPAAAAAPVVPHVESCPGCGGRLEGRACKVYCTSVACELYGRVIENCAGD